MLPLDTEANDQEMKIAEMIAGPCGHAAIIEGARWYGERCDLFDRRHRELTAKHPDHFVAMAADDTIIASKTLDGLFAEIDRRGIAREPCIIEFLNSQPIVWFI